MLKGKTVRDLADKWGYVKLDDSRVQIVRFSEFDVPKMFGGKLELKEEFLSDGYVLKPRFSCCGCLFFVPEGFHTDVCCLACDIGIPEHRPCGIETVEYLERYQKDWENKDGVVDEVNGVKEASVSGRDRKWRRELI